MIETCFELARLVLFELGSGQCSFLRHTNRFDSLYSEICFGIEFWNLGFDIWDLEFGIWNLTNSILETKVRIDQ